MAVRIPEEVIERIRSEADILDIVGRYIDLKKKGKNHFGFCPFHDENTPSFSVQEEKQLFKCFSCGRGGNVFNFLMDLEGLTFPEAVAKVAELANVDVDLSAFKAPNLTQYFDEEALRLLELNETVRDLYHYLLTTAEIGSEALGYLTKRGLEEKTIAHFKLGLSPRADDAVLRFLQNKGYDKKILVKAGLLVGEGACSHDRYRGRIIFPITDYAGRVTGFSGRAFEGSEENVAKYLNTIETPVFKKNQLLYHLDEAKQEGKRARELVLFEGYMDVISAYQAGVKNGVASLGTSLTEGQIRLLSQYTKQVLIAYDGDRAGIEASIKAIELFRQYGKNLHIELLAMPDGLDPDEYIKQYGQEAFRQLVLDARLTVLQFYRYYYRQTYPLNTDTGRISYIKAMLDVLKGENLDDIEMEVQLQTLAEETEIENDILKESLDQLRKHSSDHSSFKSRQIDISDQVSRFTALESCELQLLNRLLYIPEAFTMLNTLAPNFHFQTVTGQTVFLLLKAKKKAMGEAFIADAFLNSLVGETEQDFVTQAMLIEMPDTVREEELRDLLFRINVEGELGQQLSELKEEMALASAHDDHKQLAEINSKRIELLRKKKRLI